MLTLLPVCYYPMGRDVNVMRKSLRFRPLSALARRVAVSLKYSKHIQNGEELLYDRLYN